ncbi:MAG: Gfo/Idh/MocA family oxidoreductase [Gemmataceae bacterium]
MSQPESDRRDFLKTAAAGAAVTLAASSYNRVHGANGNINIAFLGVGGRCQQHVDVVLKMKGENKGVRPIAVCDVWDGDDKLGFDRKTNTYNGRGLYPTAKRCGISEDDKKHVTKDYRRILDDGDVDVCCIATPDHWHARMTIDCMNAGKHVYCEKPMTRTIEEAQAVVDAWKGSGKVMSVGVQSMADPTWTKCADFIRGGGIGKMLMGQTSYFRNSSVGQWRYYKLTKGMNPTTIDWNMFLGHAFDVNGVKIGPGPKEVPFDRAVYGQWRCYWPFGGGMFTDLFVHQVTHLITAMGLQYPARVVGGGGIFLEYDERDVPDVATIVADYNEGCQVLISSTMCNDHRIEEVIRGHTGTIRFVAKESNLMRGFEVIPQKLAKTSTGPTGEGAKDGTQLIEGGYKGNDESLTYGLWENFLECAKAKNQGTLSTPALGAAAFTTVAMGVKSYREGRALFWDAEQRKVKDADASWANRWEAMSKKRAKPTHIKGWTAGDKGSLLEPEDYQKLGGAWIGGKDPAGA